MNDTQSWIMWQAVTTRQQGAIEPLDACLTDFTNRFRRLNITDPEKMRYFVQGLRPEIRETVLLREPKPFLEAEEIARLTCAVKTTMSSPVMGLTRELNHLAGTSETSVSNRALLAKIEKISFKKTKELSDTNLLAKFDILIEGSPGNPSNQQPRELQTKLEKLLKKVSRKFDGSHVRDGNKVTSPCFQKPTIERRRNC